MTKIAELLAAGRTFSFEFFSPKTDDGRKNLAQALDDLVALNPAFMSVTYGAGGTSRDGTFEVVSDIRDRGVPAMAHLCCAGHSRTELVEMLDRYREAGIDNVLALKGDPPAELGLGLGDFAYALELVELVREAGPFCVGVASHPEGHPASHDKTLDRKQQAAKLTAADFGITQFFFDAETYLALVDDIARLGVSKPILPGIMPVTNVAQIERMAVMQGSAVPQWFVDTLHPVADDPDEVRRIGLDLATELSQDLLDAGAPGLHFYTLNRSATVMEIWHRLGL